MSAVVEGLERASFEGDLLSFEEFAQLSFDQRVELVEGKIQLMGWNNLLHTGVAMWLGALLTVWADETNWGLIFGGDSGVRTKRNPDTTRGADLACVSFSRYAKVATPGKVFEAGPEVLTEITSPSHTWDDIATKIIEYFAVGTDEVWVISPRNRSITIYTSPDLSHTHFAGPEGTVTSPRLPGFSFSLAAMAAKLDQIESAS
jgi:Uma2 family endonuclease